MALIGTRSRLLGPPVPTIVTCSVNETTAFSAPGTRYSASIAKSNFRRVAYSAPSWPVKFGPSTTRTPESDSLFSSDVGVVAPASVRNLKSR